MLTRGEFIRLLGASTAGSVLFPNAAKSLFQEVKFSKQLFGDDFIWGVATGAYQIEGGWNADGKGPSVWDVFTHKHGKIKDNTTGDISCDFYNKYPDDIKLLKSLNFGAFRFSVSWPRLLPYGTGEVNVKGIDFYNRLIDTCLNNGIKPWVCLYHWDLPQELENRGGWTDRSIVDYFLEYSHLCAKNYGDRVKDWLVLNEPLAFTSLGYFTGLHAPGKMGLNKFLAAVHHASLCQAEGARVLRSEIPDANIGTTFSCSYIDPKKSIPRYYNASRRLDALLNRLFIEPTLGMGYPTDALPFLNRIEKFVQPGDATKLQFDFDFIGLQNYFRIIGKPSIIPFVWANRENPEKGEAVLTDMGWEVYPEGIYKAIKRFSQYPVKKILISENGAAFTDNVENGKVHDLQRIAYYKEYLKQVLKAKSEGIPVTGYFAWTFVDNFEWAEGNSVRFGIVFNNFKNQERIIKDSGFWFRNFLK
jgi:beta-glucosidase